MTNRERILAVLDRKSPDRVPWIARLDLWYHARMIEGNMPARFLKMDLVDVGRVLRTGNPARDGRVFTTRYEGLEVRTEKAPGVLRQYFTTPYGAVSFGRILSHTVSGTTDQGLPLEHPIHRVEDYRTRVHRRAHVLRSLLRGLPVVRTRGRGRRIPHGVMRGLPFPLFSATPCRIQSGLFRNGRSS